MGVGSLGKRDPKPVVPEKEVSIPNRGLGLAKATTGDSGVFLPGQESRAISKNILSGGASPQPQGISDYFHLLAGGFCLGSEIGCTEPVAPPFPTPHPQVLQGPRAPTVLSLKGNFVHFS